ncbi:hypothetical protein HYD27_19925 [Paenibacillus sp. S150]|nr:hypothetical protein [Paenibacillus sp. S150]
MKSKAEVPLISPEAGWTVKSEAEVPLNSPEAGWTVKSARNDSSPPH